MPLRLVRLSRTVGQDTLQLAISATSLTKELSNVACFPPASAALSVLLLIFETVQGIQVRVSITPQNSDLRQNAISLSLSIDEQGGLQSRYIPLFSLARRCARILIDINDQMEGKWDSAPPSLTKNLEQFQETLKSIHQFMKIQAESKWSDRFLRKISIETALADYNELLDDASQSFQISTLISIHHAVSRSHQGEDKKKHGIQSGITSSLDQDLPPPPTYVSMLQAAAASTSPIHSVGDINQEEHLIDTSPVNEVLEDHGFRRYHQSEVRLKGRPRFTKGWWSGISTAEVNGQSSLIKRYDGPQNEAMRQWLVDVKLLQNVHPYAVKKELIPESHPNLPQMVGYSTGDTPTPFILLSNVQTRSPQALMLNKLNVDGLASCIDLILRFYQDISTATFYLQQQMCLTNHQAQDFIEAASYRIDGGNSAIMGLPPPRRNWQTARNYGLTESLKMVVMDQMLPHRGTIQTYMRNEDSDTTRRTRHLVTLARCLLPKDDDPPALSPRVKSLLGIDGDDDEVLDSRHMKLSLRQLRVFNIEADTHNHVWSENSGIPSHKFSAGDFGYIPTGKEPSDFILLGNIHTDGLADMFVGTHASGVQWCWKDTPISHMKMDGYDLPNGVKGWPVAVSPTVQIDCQIVHERQILRKVDAWRFLLDKARMLAEKFNIKPEEIMLITRAGTTQDFYIRDFRTPVHFGNQQQSQQVPFGLPHQGYGSNGHHAMTLPQQNIMPSILYLYTSPELSYQPYWSHSPTDVPDGTVRPALNRGWVYKIGWCTGSISWVQLHTEDFID